MATGAQSEIRSAEVRFAYRTRQIFAMLRTPALLGEALPLCAYPRRRDAQKTCRARARPRHVDLLDSAPLVGLRIMELDLRRLRTTERLLNEPAMVCGMPSRRSRFAMGVARPPGTSLATDKAALRRPRTARVAEQGTRNLDPIRDFLEYRHVSQTMTSQPLEAVSSGKHAASNAAQKTKHDACGLVEKYFSSLNAQDFETTLTLVSDNIVHDSSQGTRIWGREAFREYLRKMQRHFREHVFDIRIASNENGDFAAAEFTVLGICMSEDNSDSTPPPQSYRLYGGAFFELAHQQIERVSHYRALSELPLSD